MIRDILSRRDLTLLAGLTLLAAVSALFDAVSVGLVFPIIKIFEDPSFIQSQAQLSFIYDLFGFDDERIFVATIAAFLIALIILKNIVLALGINTRAGIVEDSRIRIAHRLLTTYLLSPYTFHLQHNSATLIRNVYSSVRTLFGNCIRGYLDLGTELLGVGAILIVLLVIHPLITISVVGFFVLAFGANQYFFKGLLGSIGAQTQIVEEKVLVILNQSLGAAKEAALLHREGFFAEKFLLNGRDAARIQRIMELVGGAPRLIVESLSATALFGIIIVVALNRSDDSDILGLMGLFAVAAFRIMPSVSRIVQALSNIRLGSAAMEIVWNDLQLPRDLRALPAKADVQPIAFDDSIELRDVEYSYPDTTRVALRGINLALKKGRAHALIGPSGAGKSTIADVVLGLIAPVRGALFVDGRDVRENMKSWQLQIGYVPQSIYLTDDTLRRNVAFALPDEAIDDARVREVMRLAKLEDFVATLPQGLETIIGERGTRLSGGQRQRIGIARALYGSPELLVLDEATSAIDTETENEITAAIFSLVGDMTLLIIAHRLNTVRQCDNVFLVNDGAISDIGKLGELSEREPALAQWLPNANPLDVGLQTTEPKP